MGIHFTWSPKIKKSTNQNSGVRFDTANDNGTKDTYYGYIEEIWELDYGPSFKVPLFWCKWVKLIGGKVKVDQQYGITTVDLNNLGYRDEPFVLANKVAQIFYVKDMSTKPRKRKDKKTNTSHNEPKRHIILLGKRIIVGVEDRTDMSEDYNKFDEIPPFKVNTDPTILLSKEDTPWLRCRRKPQHYMGMLVMCNNVLNLLCKCMIRTLFIIQVLSDSEVCKNNIN
jgi:hypothetical protein